MPIAAFSAIAFFLIILQVLIMADFAKEMKSNAPALFGSTYCISLLGVLTGAIIGSYSGPWSSAVLSGLLCCFVVVVGALSIHYANSNDEKTETVINGTELLDSSEWDTRFDELCESGDLSKRQREVFSLLAKGRNAKYISETLFIAPHTTKTHIYRIYQKLGIHSQQELLDLFENGKK